MPIVAATTSFHVFDGSPPVHRGEMFDSEHPLVVRHPGLFAAPTLRDVEQATRAPGETSTARRSLTPDDDDPKARWVAYAEENGHDTEGLTKAQIVALCT